jgi:HK97 family phage major capsid protein
MNSTELRQRRASLWEQAKSLHDLADKEKRQLTAEERNQWDEINKDIDSLKETIDRVERITAMDSELNDVIPPVSQPEIKHIEQYGQTFEDEIESPFPASKEYKKAFRSYIRQGFLGMNSDQRAILQPYYSNGPVNLRAVQTTGGGGALIAEDFYRQLVEAMQAFGGMRQARTTKIQTSTGADMPIPLVDDTYNTGAILSEGSNLSSSVDPSFGTKTLGAFMYTSKLVLVSLQMLQDSAFNFETWLAAALGRRLGRITNEHFTNGTGSGSQPEGLLYAAPAGVTDAAIDIDYADLVALEHSVDPAYRANGAQWMFHDTTLALLKQMKAVEDGRPLWLPGLAVNAPDTILGYPYIINQAMPEAEEEAKAILFGDFSYYFIRDVQDVRVLRLEERYAEYLQVGFIAFMRCDGLFATPTAISGGSEQTANESAPVKYLQFEAGSA